MLNFACDIPQGCQSEAKKKEREREMNQPDVTSATNCKRQRERRFSSSNQTAGIQHKQLFQTLNLRKLNLPVHGLIMRHNNMRILI